MVSANTLKKEKNDELTIGTKTCVSIQKCQVCHSSELETILFLGYMPPVNQMRIQGEKPEEQPSYPLSLLRCKTCELLQIGQIVDPEILFPPEYPYTSGTTKILHENFDELAAESTSFIPINDSDYVVDIGSNDGTLLSKFKDRGCKVLGIEPTDVGKLARERGIDTETAYFNKEVAETVAKKRGKAKLITAANVFAHIENVHGIMEGIDNLLSDDGVFISESHYLISLMETVQYDTVYHEHLRYYSLHSIQHLLEMHNFEIIKAKKIPTHGGSIRVYAARKGTYPVDASIKELLLSEPTGESLNDKLKEFKEAVISSKLELMHLLCELKRNKKTICGISAPSRASTLVIYAGLNEGLIDFVAEVNGSLKIGKYMPGTLIPVVNQQDYLFGENQPDYALILSWHIADELIEKLRSKGFKGKFIIPLPVVSVK